MSIISEKVAYLKGLAEGLNVAEKSPEGKVLAEIINVLGSISDEIEAHEDAHDELFDKVFDLEDAVYGEEDEDEEYYDEDEEFSIKCPTCNEEFFLTFEDLESDDDIVCPYCNQEIDLGLDDCDGDCEGCKGCE